MYAIVKTGGKQYRVEEGQSLLVERLTADGGAKVGLEPLLYVDGSNVVDGDDLAKVKVEARVVGHERGPKLRIVKFKPKRGYKRRTGHRQELTRLEVTSVKLAARRSAAKPAAEKAEPKPVAATPAAAKPAAAKAERAKPDAAKPEAAKPAGKTGAAKPEAAKPARKTGAAKPAAKPGAAKPAAKPKAPARKPRTTKTEDDNGA
jgi:large subunit ribosomal protein L21